MTRLRGDSLGRKAKSAKRRAIGRRVPSVIGVLDRAEIFEDPLSRGFECELATSFVVHFPARDC
jgi:hypothetical protein